MARNSGSDNTWLVLLLAGLAAWWYYSQSSTAAPSTAAAPLIAVPNATAPTVTTPYAQAVATPSGGAVAIPPVRPTTPVNPLANTPTFSLHPQIVFPDDFVGSDVIGGGGLVTGPIGSPSIEREY